MRSASPLRLLAANGGGHAAWVYQSNLGGGFVGRDDISLAVTVERDASLFLGTQASTKVYRGTNARSAIDATVDAGATLVAWPDPVTCFAGATFDQTLRFAIAGSANLLVVDPWTSGRAARGERWQFARVASRISIAVDGTSVLDDGFVLDGAHGDVAERMRDTDAFATIFVIGPRFAPDALIDRISTRPIAAQPWIVGSRWPWGAVIRIGARDAETMARATRELVGETVCAMLGVDPWARRS
jgi:urease accessory protein